METHVRPGWIEVICGSMFSGKTEELIRRIRRAQIARQRVEIFKPRLDNRYSETHIVAHSDQSIPSTLIESAAEMILLSENADVIGIDEVQFLGMEVVPVVEHLANAGKRVICAGLDQDFRGLPFEPVPQLLAIAEYITKTQAICMVCGAPALRSQRLTAATSRVQLGAKDSYEPRCRHCFVPPPAEKKG
ncbi:MAG: thymidine kinase [Bacteroidetes bacterium]|nr:thymidine kinase [Bacteroidota bacterium]